LDVSSSPRTWRFGNTQSHALKHTQASTTCHFAHEGCHNKLDFTQTLGVNGTGYVHRRTESQFRRSNHLWALMSSAPPRKHPSRFVLSAVSSRRMRSFASGSTCLHKHTGVIREPRITVRCHGHALNGATNSSACIVQRYSCRCTTASITSGTQSGLRGSSGRCRRGFRRRKAGTPPTFRRSKCPAPTSQPTSRGLCSETHFQQWGEKTHHHRVMGDAGRVTIAWSHLNDLRSEILGRATQRPRPGGAGENTNTPSTTATHDLGRTRATNGDDACPTDR
jgi:hypothetical protein